MAEVKKARLFLRRGSDTDRRDTVLCQGELGYSTDAFRIFIGDGSTEGGKSVGSFMYVSGGNLGTNFHTNLTTASANGRAHKGDIAIFPAQSYTNAAGTAATDSRGANEPKFKSFSNKPIIIKDYYEVSGSDVSRIGWVEVASEECESGYLWYLKAEADTRARFTDYIEMAMLEAKTGGITDDGSVSDFLNDIIYFIEENDLSNNDNYITLCNRMDIDSYIDYIIIQTYIRNTDWPVGNVKWW